MPTTLIETREGWVESSEHLLEAIQAGITEALQLPVLDRTIRLVEHSPSHFLTPPDRGSRYTLITINMFKGRTIETKRRLYKLLVKALENFGVPPLDVTIAIVEIEPSNWGVSGGQPASEVDLGFKIDI